MKHKVFCIGAHKTGTTSLEVALRKLGYRVRGSFGTKDPDIANKVHEMAYAMVEQYDAFEDPAAREIASWLRGEYAFDPACLTG